MLGLIIQLQQLPISATEIILFVVLLLASAVVSGSEVALFSLSETDREALKEQDDRQSRLVLALLDKSRQSLVTILFLNTLINVSVAILAALVTKKIAEASDLPYEIVFAIEVVALTLTLLIISEITPKLIASRYAIAYSRRIAGVLSLVSRPLFPITFLLTRFTDGIQRIYQNLENRDSSELLSSEDLKTMAEIGKDHGSIEEDEHRWIQSLMDFGDTPVRSIMVNRLDICSIPITASLAEALEIIRSCGHSRLPLYKDHLDNIQGIAYAKDLLSYLDQPTSDVDWNRIMRPPIFVPLVRKIDDLLKDFQTLRTHVAIVVDEYGGTAGLVTLEDVLEEVVGEIEDEHDEARDALISELGDQTYRIDPRISLVDLNDSLNLSLPTDDYEFETLGGLIFQLAGDIPEPGFTTIHHQLELSVVEVENNRIRLVDVRLLEDSDEASGMESSHLKP
ncbi:MAG: hemolysin family protein [Bacteroidetes bacterium]|nr:hemolysin family protein [Bacteroidota bacterium]